MENSDFVQVILKWYGLHKRDLPWRNTRDPYRIWLSEIILQQTRIIQGLPYYNRFIEAFPEIAALAKAEELEILRLWQGLGYYSRARNLHATAKYVVQNYGGKFPQSYNNLLTLKGIGPYTAAAIASFAFGEKVAVLDGNVFRVLSRYFGITEDIAGSRAKKVFGELAASLVPEKYPDTYNQAIMEFGALQCVPASPDCSSCPLSQGCFARMNGLQARLPLKSKSKAKKQRHFNYLLLEKGNRLYLQQRKEGDIWNGLFEFKLIETENPADENEILAWLVNNSIQGIISKQSEIYKHILSHQVIHARFWQVRVENEGVVWESSGKYFTVNEIEGLPKPVLINNYLREHIF